jgi:hypothetical protein
MQRCELQSNNERDFITQVCEFSHGCWHSSSWPPLATARRQQLWSQSLLLVPAPAPSCHQPTHAQPTTPQAMREEIRIDGRTMYDWRPLRVQVCPSRGARRPRLSSRVAHCCCCWTGLTAALMSPTHSYY